LDAHGGITMAIITAGTTDIIMTTTVDTSTAHKHALINFTSGIGDVKK
jgi:hypothetical protein